MRGRSSACMIVGTGPGTTSDFHDAIEPRKGNKRVGFSRSEMGSVEGVRGGMLDLLGVPEAEHAPDGIRVVATVLGPREPGEALESALAASLRRLNVQPSESKGERRLPAAVVIEAMDHSDSATRSSHHWQLPREMVESAGRPPGIRRGRPAPGSYGWLPGPPWLLQEAGRSEFLPVHCPDLPAPLPPSVGGDGLAPTIGAVATASAPIERDHPPRRTRIERVWAAPVRPLMSCRGIGTIRCLQDGGRRVGASRRTWRRHRCRAPRLVPARQGRRARSVATAMGLIPDAPFAVRPRQSGSTDRKERDGIS